MQEKGSLLYEGKAKRIFEVVGDSGLVWQEFKDSLTAFDGKKKGEFSKKGALNRDISSLVFRYLEKNGIRTQWVEDVDASDMVTARLNMVPLEVVCRNRAAGSLVKKFRFEEGKVIDPPLVEIFYKDDSLGDPFLSDEQAMMLGVVETPILNKMKAKALEVNKALQGFFLEVGLILVDFKLEFGLDKNGEVILGDEVTPDTCRLWDEKTLEKMDKDRFRLDMGGVDKSYEAICDRLEKSWGEKI